MTKGRHQSVLGGLRLLWFSKIITGILHHSDFWNFPLEPTHSPVQQPSPYAPPAIQQGRPLLAPLSVLVPKVSPTHPTPSPREPGRPALEHISSQLWPANHFPLSCLQICNTTGMTTPTSQACSEDPWVGPQPTARAQGASRAGAAGAAVWASPSLVAHLGSRTQGSPA